MDIDMAIVVYETQVDKYCYCKKLVDRCRYEENAYIGTHTGTDLIIGGYLSTYHAAQNFGGFGGFPVNHQSFIHQIL